MISLSVMLHPIVACRTLHGSTDPPCTLDMRIYPSNMMIFPIILSYQNSISRIIGRSEESITDSVPDPRRFRIIFDSAQGLCKPRRRFCTQKGMTVSKSTFEDPHFRTMTQTYYVTGGGSGKASYLTRHGLVKYLDAEFALMLKFTKFATESLFEYACGNGFVQNLHDDATLQVNSNIPRICVSL